MSLINRLIHYLYYLGPSKLQCKFPDEDPFDSCLPVNCHMKYSGYRGFYSISEKKCIKIPICQSNNKSKQVNELFYLII